MAGKTKLVKEKRIKSYTEPKPGKIMSQALDKQIKCFIMVIR